MKFQCSNEELIDSLKLISSNISDVKSMLDSPDVSDDMRKKMVSIIGYGYVVIADIVSDMQDRGMPASDLMREHVDIFQQGN